MADPISMYGDTRGERVAHLAALCSAPSAGTGLGEGNPEAEAMSSTGRVAMLLTWQIGQGLLERAEVDEAADLARHALDHDEDSMAEILGVSDGPPLCRWGQAVVILDEVLRRTA